MSSSVVENIVAKSVSFDSIVVDGSSIGHKQVLTKKGVAVDGAVVIKSGAITLPANSLITSLSIVVTTEIAKSGSATSTQQVGTSEGTGDIVAGTPGQMQTTGSDKLVVGRGNSTDVSLARPGGPSTGGLRATGAMVIEPGKAFHAAGVSLYMELMVPSPKTITDGACNFIVEFTVL